MRKVEDCTPNTPVDVRLEYYADLLSNIIAPNTVGEQSRQAVDVIETWLRKVVAKTRGEV